MNTSHSEQVLLTCPHCQENLVHQVWLLVDAQERPDLAEQVREGSLHQVRCSGCQETIGWLDAPLLYHDGAQEQLIFSPAQGTSRDRDAQDLTQLVERLTTMLSEARLAPYMERPTIVPMPLLPAYLSGGQEAVEQALDNMWRQTMEQFPPHVQQALKELKEAEIETMEEMEAFLAERPELVEPLEAAGVATSQLQQDLLTFVQADTWTESREILEATPALGGESAAAELVRMAERARERQDPDMAGAMQEHRELLARCRSIGVKAAFLEKVTGLPQKEAEKLMRAALDTLLGLGPGAERDELAQVLGQYTILLSGEALIHLQDRIQELRRQGQDQVVGEAETIHDKLHLIQQTGL